MSVSNVFRVQLSDGAYALLAASIGSRFTHAVLRGPMPRYLSGSVYLGLGLCTLIRRHL
jgi:hypothetical protein